VTAGPHLEETKSTVVGEAAHITAASRGGPRYDAGLSEEHRKSSANAIWLCRICARLIDAAPGSYPVSLLEGWKASAEEAAKTEPGRPAILSALDTRADAPTGSRVFADALLSLSSPPLLAARFPEPPQPVAEALRRLSALKRTLVRRDDPQTVVDLRRLQSVEGRLHLITGPGGGGKTHALWNAARDALAEADAPPWLFITASDFDTADDLLRFVRELAEREHSTAVLDAPGVVICLDGWTEFPRTSRPGEEHERRRVLAAFPHNRVIATGRHAREDDTRFTIWELQPMPESALEGLALDTSIHHDASTGRSISHLPLVVVLSLLLGRSVESRGVLLDRYHRHQTRDLREASRLLDAISLAAADCCTRTPPKYATFIGMFDRQASKLGLAEGRDLLTRIGTLAEHRGQLRPVHDLYWEWLVGRGLLLLGTPLPTSVARRLDLRDSIALALESGVACTAEQVCASAPIDVQLAALLASGLPNSGQNGESARALVVKRASELLEDTDAAERYRGALAAVRAGDDELLEHAVRSLPETREKLSIFDEIVAALPLERLWCARDRLERHLEQKGVRTLILEVVAARGDDRWEPWLERLFKQGRIPLAEASAAAVACASSMPHWCAHHDNPLFSTESYRLRIVSERGRNAVAADWLADQLERLPPSNSMPFHVGRLIASCAHDSALERMIERLPTMTESSLDAASYIFDLRGREWIGRAQTVLYGLLPPRSGAFGMAEPGIVTEATARAWIGSTSEVIQSMGWRALARILGKAALPELLSALPPSFGNRDRIPALGALAELDTLPETLMGELFGRLTRADGHADTSLITPGVFEQFVGAVCKITPGGVPRMIGMALHQPRLFDGYQLSRLFPLWLDWERRTGLEVRVGSDSGPPLHARLLYDRLKAEPTAPLMPRAVRALGPPAASEEIADKAGQGDQTACSIIQQVKMRKFHPGIFERLSSANEFDELVSVFEAALPTFPSDALMRLAQMASGSDPRMDRLLGSFSAIGPLIPDDAVELIVRDAASRGLPSAWRRLRLAGLLASRSSALIRRVLADPADPVARWLIRTAESARGELLLDDRGSWFSDAPRTATPSAHTTPGEPPPDEELLLFLSDEERQATQGRFVRVHDVALVSGLSEGACWNTLRQLATHALVEVSDAGPGRSYDNAAALTKEGRERSLALRLPPALGPVSEFVEGIDDVERRVLDIVLEQHLRLGLCDGAPKRSEIRTRVKKQRPELDTTGLNRAIDALTGSYLRTLNDEETTFAVTLRGLLASRWGGNALELIELTLGALRRLLLDDPSLRLITWRDLREATGLSHKAMNLADLSINLAGLGTGPVMVGDSRTLGWRVQKDLDVLLENATTALDHVRKPLVATVRHPVTSKLNGAAPPIAVDVGMPVDLRPRTEQSAHSLGGPMHGVYAVSASSGCGERDQSDRLADLLLVVATDVEHEAVMRAARAITGAPQPKGPIHGRHRTYDDLGTIGGARVVVVQTEMGTATAGGSLATVLTAIDEIRPATAIMVGIAFGVDPAKQPIGTVLVAKQIHPYGPQRIGTGTDGKTRKVLKRGDRASSSPTVLSRLRASRTATAEFKVDFGLLLSGESLVDNYESREELRSLEPEALGGEMEGGGLYVAAVERQIAWCLVKAVCDYADGNKGVDKKARQRIAADNAATYVLNAVQAGGFAHPDSRADTPAGSKSPHDIVGSGLPLGGRAAMVPPGVDESPAPRENVPAQTTTATIVDFVIITALPDERDAVLAHLVGPRKLPKDDDDFHTYYEADLQTRRPDRATYRIIVTCLSNMGPQRAAAKTVAVVRRWSPRHVLLVGIAGGVRGEVDLGDVLIAEQIADYTLGKVEPERGILGRIRRFMGSLGRRRVRWQVYRTAPNLFDSAHNLEAGWEKRIKEPRPGPGAPVRRDGVIASGGDVVAFEELIFEYQSIWGKLIGVEMEAAGAAGMLDEMPSKPRFFMIRSASDYANPSKNAPETKKWRKYAYDVAAAYTVALLTEGPVPPAGAHGASLGGSPSSGPSEHGQDTRARDLRALRDFWLRLPLDEADHFFDRAGYHIIPHSTFFYYDEIEALDAATGFHIYDVETRTAVTAFVKPFLRTIARDEFFRELPSGSESKFIASHQHADSAEHANELRVFQTSVHDAHAAYKRLVALTREKWREIDLQEVSRQARERRRRAEEDG